MPITRFTVQSIPDHDPLSINLLADARALGLNNLRQIHHHDLFFIEGNLDPVACNTLAVSLLSDPLTQRCEWSSFDPNQSIPANPHQVEVALRPGVTDPVADQLVRAGREMGIVGLQRASTGQQYLIDGDDVSENDLRQLTSRLLANPVIQRYVIGMVEPVFSSDSQQSEQIDCINLRGLDDEELVQLSLERRAALDLPEMKAIQAYFISEGRDPTDVEFETFAQTWSEHCVHKTFKARIEIDRSCFNHPYPPEVNSLFETYIKKATQEINAPWVLSSFTDNAGILAFDDQFEVSFKVETHNHPSAIEPFGGANTGVGGVIRDVIGVSAKPIANTDVLCFGPQDTPLDKLAEGVLHPRRIFSGVVAGVQDYGNKMGIPTVNGAIWFDPGFTANPLVFCGCVGLAPRGIHPREAQPGDRVIVLGGRTGRDGLRGATFSSMTMDAKTGEVAGASVQIGDPIVEKGVLEVVLRARDQRLYTAITDCGAGGLSSAVGEMANPQGADVDLAEVRLKYPGLAPWEIWLSEAQERMVLAVPPASCDPLKKICALFEVDYTDLGAFTNTRHLIVRASGQVVLDLACQFLYNGLPQRHLKASLQPAVSTPASGESRAVPSAEASDSPDITLILKALLSHPNIASKEAVIRIYDHEVQGGTVIKPLVGVMADGPSDACVLKPAQTSRMTGLVLSNGLNPEYGKQDAYRMAASAVDEAVRNAVAVGADPAHIALLDNFCWGDPRRPEVMGTLLEAARGCYESALLFQAPFISGKDSFNNEYMARNHQRQSIPPTLLISAIGIVPDVTCMTTMDLKRPGDLLYLVGEHRPVFCGSHYNLVSRTPVLSDPLPPEPSLLSLRVYQALHQAITVSRLVQACHDISEGGLLTAAAEMAIAGRLGVRLAPDFIPNSPQADLLTWCFGETNGCLLVEVPIASAQDFENLFSSLPCQRIGILRADHQVILDHPSVHLSISVDQLVNAWNSKGNS